MVGKSERKNLLGRPRHRWVDNVKVDLKERYGLNLCGSGQGPVEGSCEQSNEPSGSIKCWELLEYLHTW
jgi:hypothetical protein